MQPDTHPTYGPVAFRDRSTGRIFLTRSTLAGREGRTVEVDGQDFPVVDCDVTSDSHPFWTGRKRTMDSEGRVERFERRYAKARGDGGGR